MINKFLDYEAEEGNDSDDGQNKVSAKKNHQEYYYRDQDLRKKTLGVESVVNKIEQKENRKQEKREAKLKELEKRRTQNYSDRQSSNEEEEDSDDESNSNGLMSDQDDPKYLQEEYNEQRKYLPSINDPKLWQVRVKKGSERIAAMGLMNKCIDYASRKQPFSIISASYLENLEQHIFVEAYKIENVREAISGLSYCFQKIDIVPLNEMTRIFEDQNAQLVRPKQGQWIRIKGGLYQGDIGIVEQYINDDKIFVKLIPRFDPNSFRPSENTNKDTKKKFMFQRHAQNAFSEDFLKETNPKLYKEGQKIQLQKSTKIYYQLKGNLYRKGFICKQFSLKQIDSQNISPRQDERQNFQEIFNKFNKNDGDSSDVETNMIINSDLAVDLNIGEKIYINEGDLQKTIGVIVNFDDGGQTVIFKPTSIQGYDENISIERKYCLKYYQQGDAVIIKDGKYQGESGLITSIDPENIQIVNVKLESQQIDVKIKTQSLKMKEFRDQEQGKSLNNPFDQLGIEQLKSKSADQKYFVGDIIIYDSNKIHGYIVKVEQDQVYVVNELGNLQFVKLHQIHNKMIVDNKRAARDAMGNSIQVDDAVKVTNNKSIYKDKHGIIKKICKNILFLWDKSFMNISNGIFVEQSGNVTLKGYEFLQNDQDRHAPGLNNQNRIQKHKWLNQTVLIVRGIYKGQYGRVTHVNEDQAIIEMSIRAKKINIPLADLKEVDQDKQDNQQSKGGYQNNRKHDQNMEMDYYGGAQQNGGMTNYGGGQTTYGGGQTAYEIGKTPMATNTPLYNNLSNVQDQNNLWGSNFDQAPKYI